MKEAEDGELIQKGTAYIAPGGYPFKSEKSGKGIAVVLDQSEPRNGHRPSVDVMFDSVAKLDDLYKIAVIMTGMGSDGANGLIHLKERTRSSESYCRVTRNVYCIWNAKGCYCDSFSR